MRNNEITDVERPKRDKKIYIASVAIDKVPYINIPNFLNKQNDMLQQYHRDILIISKDKNDSNEVLRVWNFVKGMALDILGSETKVSFADNAEVISLFRNSGIYELAYLHNPPSASSFSLPDVA